MEIGYFLYLIVTGLGKIFIFLSTVIGYFFSSTGHGTNDVAGHIVADWPWVAFGIFVITMIIFCCCFCCCFSFFAQQLPRTRNGFIFCGILILLMLLSTFLVYMRIRSIHDRYYIIIRSTSSR